MVNWNFEVEDKTKAKSKGPHHSYYVFAEAWFMRKTKKYNDYKTDYI